MQLLRRHKSVLIALGIYWPVIFWLTHIPVPDIARQSGMSDKTMHVLAYFVLTFLIWFTISPYEKVQWRCFAPLHFSYPWCVHAITDQRNLVPFTPEGQTVNKEKEWVLAWGRAGREIEALRRLTLSRLETVPASVLDSLFELGLRRGQPRLTSGLVEQQRVFRKARR